VGAVNVAVPTHLQHALTTRGVEAGLHGACRAIQSGMDCPEAEGERPALELCEQVIVASHAEVANP
jgi:hypothetical protein